MPLVSIIVPVYNAENTLEKCLDSLTAQTYKNIEILLVNDGSCDSSVEICREYCRKNAQFHLLSQMNSGPASARNNGIDHACGKYIYFVDADDYIEPQAIEKLVDAAEKYEAEMVICSYFVETPDSISVPHTYFTSSKLFTGEECRALSERLIDDTSPGRIPPYSWVRMIRRECLNNPRIRYEDGMIRSEDFHFYVRLQFRLNRIYVMSEPLYHYVEVKTSITHTYVPKYWDSVKKIYMSLLEMLPCNENIQEKMKIMFLNRTMIALNNSSHADNIETFCSETSEIISDPLLVQVVDTFSVKKGIRRFGAFYLLMKLRMYFIVQYRYKIKFMRERRNRSFEDQ